MKYLFLNIFFFVCGILSAQNIDLKIQGINDSEKKTIDSISFNKKHKTNESVLAEVKIVVEKLSKKGFIDIQNLGTKKTSDSTFVANLSLKQKINFIHIYIGRNPEAKKLKLFDSENDSITIKYAEIENFLNNSISSLEKKGFALAKIKLINIQRDKNNLTAELSVILDKKRTLNGIVINGYDKFPEGFKKQINRKYRKTTFNKENLKLVYDDFNKIRFVKQTKYPEILFTTDSTKVYAYIEKAKINSFDGILGFANDEKRNLIFNGYVNLSLNNALNAGEKLDLNWKSDGKNQKTFNIATEIPYIFKTPIGVKAQLNIFKQDSLFQNTKTSIDLGYYLKFNSRLYLGYQSTESNDIQNLNTNLISDSQNSFVTSTYEFKDYKNDDLLFPEKTNFEFKLGNGRRTTKIQNDKQNFASLNINHHFYLNKIFAINLKTQNYFLKSNNYISSEQLRFGGINSVRGFNENSLQANALLSLISEFQYVLSPNLYFHSVLDYAYFEDKTTNKSNKLLGLGFGFGLLNKNGLLKFVYSNGSTNEQAIQLSNSIVQISLTSNF